MLEPELFAVLRMYPSEESGRIAPISQGFRCPSFAQKDVASGGGTCFIHIGALPLAPGETRCVGFNFITREWLELMRAAGTFYLWDGQFFGEATIDALKGDIAP